MHQPNYTALHCKRSNELPWAHNSQIHVYKFSLSSCHLPTA